MLLCDKKNGGGSVFIFHNYVKLAFSAFLMCFRGFISNFLDEKTIVMYFSSIMNRLPH